MPNKVTIEKVESLARQLQPAEQLRLLGNISTKLSDALSGGPIVDEKTRQERLHLAEELLAECKGAHHDSQGYLKRLDMTRHRSAGKIKSRKARLAKADALLAKLDAIAESIKGKFDSAKDIRELREERTNRL
jgi:hypothetical protein